MVQSSIVGVVPGSNLVLQETHGRFRGTHRGVCDREAGDQLLAQRFLLVD
jgi:hypothetical protein